MTTAHAHLCNGLWVPTQNSVNPTRSGILEYFSSDDPHLKQPTENYCRFSEQLMMFKFHI